MIFFLDCTCVDKTKRAVGPHFRFVTRLDIGRRRLNSSLELHSWTELSDVFRLIQEGPLGLLLLKPCQLTSVFESQKIINVKLCLNKLLQTTRVKCLLKRLGQKPFGWCQCIFVTMSGCDGDSDMSSMSCSDVLLFKCIDLLLTSRKSFYPYKVWAIICNKPKLNPT